MSDSSICTELAPMVARAEQDAALAPLLASIAARLRPACAHLGPGEFDGLVLGIARTKQRWAARDRAI